MVAITRSGLEGYGVGRADAFAPKVAVPVEVTWTLVLNFDPTWIGNSRTCVAVNGYLMSSGASNIPIAPWIPEGTQ